MKKSYLLAGGLAVAATAWIVSGQFGAEEAAPVKTAASEQGATTAVRVPQVRVRTIVARERTNELVLLGQTKASRSVELKAETSGRVIAIGARKGDTVKAGTVIARLAINDRQAKLAEAKALVSQRAMEFKAAKDLSKKNFRSQTQLAASAAQLDAAKAYQKQAEIDLAHTSIRAPFDGVLDTREVEIGDFVDVGDLVATVVDLSPILVVGSVTEREIPLVKVGATATARLVTGHSVEGRIRYVSSVAQETTRTFEVELEAPNEDGSLVSGITAEMRLSLNSTMAHLVSPAVLTLSDAGKVGVKGIVDENLVRFFPVDVLADTESGVWLGGLPAEVTVITVGQEFVQDGQTVVPVPEKMPPVSKLEDRG